jgi:hypothetical protein
MGNLVSLHALVHFNLATHLPDDGDISVPDLAKASKMHPDDLGLIVHHGAARRLLTRTDDGKVAHSAISKALITVPNLQNFVEGASCNMWVGAPAVVTVMENFPGSQEPKESAYSLGSQTGRSFWEDLEANPRKGGKFAQAMTFMQSGPALKPEFVLEYNWSQHANGTVVDVGGSQGGIAATIAQNYPSMKIIVQDRPEIIAHAPESMHKNLQFQAHDFFTTQPVHGADVYLFRWILHDWSTKYCIKILQALIPALKPKARIVLMEAMLPEPGVLSPYQEQPIRNYDVVMKMLFNGRERSESDWRKLIADADESGRFKVVEVLRPAKSQLGFLVVEWMG